MPGVIIDHRQHELATDKGEQTRNLIFTSALKLFREHGFDATTMQGIATHSGVAKGAAYSYFPSKEALIQAHYETVQTEEERLCTEFFATNKPFKSRLRLLKVDVEGYEPEVFARAVHTLASRSL